MSDKSKLLHIIENLNDVIWTIDINTSRFTYVSPSVTQLLGYSVKEALEGIFDNNPNNNESYRTTQKKIQTELGELIHSGREYSDMRFEYQMPNKKGMQVWVETEIRILKEDGSPKEILGITRNIEERKKIETLLQDYTTKLEKINDEKDLFIKILAHDLRSPFNALLGFSNYLLETLNEISLNKIEEKLKLINQKLYGTFHLLEDLLVWARFQSGSLPSTPEDISFAELCEDILSSITSNSKNIQINYFESEKITLHTDVNILKAILRNLISNAIKFSNEKGVIKIYAIKSPENITITVADNGVGLTDEQIDNIWQKIETTKGTRGEKGFGLGLVVCNELVEKLGGKIDIASKPGEGSKFIISLPV